MPFTAAHPAIILPLRKYGYKLSWTGLIIGSMVPDFEFFFRLRETENFGHQLIGVILLDIPLAILASFLFHNVIRNQFIDHLPNWYKKRFLIYRNFNWNQYFKAHYKTIFISIIIGIATHLFWDGFTHYNGFFVTHVSFFSKRYSLFSFALPIYWILQILSSIIGLVILQVFIRKIPESSDNNIRAEKNFIYWMAIINITGVVFMARLILLPQYESKMDLLIAFLGSILYAWIFINFVFTYLVAKIDNKK